MPGFLGSFKPTARVTCRVGFFARLIVFLLIIPLLLRLPLPPPLLSLPPLSLLPTSLRRGRDDVATTKQHRKTIEMCRTLFGYS